MHLRVTLDSIIMSQWGHKYWLLYLNYITYYCLKWIDSKGLILRWHQEPAGEVLHLPSCSLPTTTRFWQTSYRATALPTCASLAPEAVASLQLWQRWRTCWATRLSLFSFIRQVLYSSIAQAFLSFSSSIYISYFRVLMGIVFAQKQQSLALQLTLWYNNR